MGNCGLKPKVEETDVAPIEGEETKVEDRELVIEAAAEGGDSADKVVEAKETPKDDKTEAPAPAKEEVKAEITGDSSSKAATEEKSVPVVATTEPAKVEAPAPVAAAVPAPVVPEIQEKKEIKPVVEAPKVTEPVVATKPEASVAKPAAAATATEKVPIVEVRKEEVSPVTPVAKPTAEAAKPK